MRPASVMNLIQHVLDQFHIKTKTQVCNEHHSTVFTLL